MPIPQWAIDYVGVPFVEHGRDAGGCDCWGLVRLVYREVFGRVLPGYYGAYSDSHDGASISALINREARHWAPVDKPRPGDVVVCRIEGRPWHVGVLLTEGVMLHTERGTDAVVERIDGLRWQRRIEGYYRYEQ